MNKADISEELTLSKEPTIGGGGGLTHPFKQIFLCG